MIDLKLILNVAVGVALAPVAAFLIYGALIIGYALMLS